MYIYRFLFLFAFIRYANCDGCSPTVQKPAEARLREKLFACYNKNVRPVKSWNNQTSVYFQLYPNKIYMEHYYESITVHGNILYVWHDMFLTWDMKEFEGIDFLRVSSDEIWVPDITHDAPSQVESSSTRMNTVDCHITHTGTVYCFPRTTIRSQCSADLTKYPFDRQNCTLLFSSFGYYGKYVNLSLFDPKNGMRMINYRPDKNWEVLQYSVQSQVKYFAPEDNSSYYPYIRCNLILKRISTSQQAMVVLPATGLAVLTLLTFWMGSMHSSRLMMTGVSIIGDVLYLTYLGFAMSSNGSNTPIILVFLRDSFIISIYATFITILVRNMLMKTTEPPNWIASLTSKIESTFLATILLSELPSAPKDDDTVSIIDSPKLKNTPWFQFATLVDRFSFISSFVALTVLVFSYLP